MLASFAQLFSLQSGTLSSGSQKDATRENRASSARLMWVLLRNKFDVSVCDAHDKTPLTPS